MKIIQGDKLTIDLEFPIEATEEQKNRFINFFKANYKAVKVKEVSSFRKEDNRLSPNKMTVRKFIDEEFPYILNLDYDSDDVAHMLARPRMTIAKKRGELLPAFISWTKETNRDMIKEDMEKLIADFVEYQKKMKIDKKKQQKDKRKEKKEFEELKKELELWKSPEKKELLKKYKSLGALKEDVDEVIRKKIKEIEEQLKEHER